MNTSTCAAVAPVLPHRRPPRSGGAGRPPVRRLLAVLAAASLAPAACGGAASPSASSLLKDAFASHKPIRSGLLGLSFALSSHGAAAAGKGSFSLRLAGPFQSAGAGRLPSFALALTLETAGRKLAAGATETAGRLYLDLAGASFLAPASTMTALEQGYAQASGGSAAAKGGLTFATLGLHPEGWLTHPAIAGSGKDTVHIVAGLDAARFLADVERLSSSGLALGAGQGTGLLTPARSQALSSSVRVGRVDVYTGAQDHLLRRLVLRAAVSSTPAARAAVGGLTAGTLTFELQFAQLNVPQAIIPPARARPSSALGSAVERLSSGRGLAPR
ncbi:MAG TPA: hypothetical protein VNZ01_10920 [Solirubrobacteraceae bacterium]|jgi:hypothetical protein|nr:hypothetical protein [Solirubrobacteraceae bacterium]